MADKDIVSRNLGVMEREMEALSKEESISGSMIIEGQRYPCVYLNGYADKQTGEILAFGNFQDIPEEIKNKGVKFIFKEAKTPNIGVYS